MTAQPNPVMPLEEVVMGLREMLRYDSAQEWPFNLNEDDKSSIASALHYLEQRRRCGNAVLESRINAIINHGQFEKELAMRGVLLPEFQCDWHTFGGFEYLPPKYQIAILRTEEKITTQ